jgi:hypothetical protein
MLLLSDNASGIHINQRDVFDDPDQAENLAGDNWQDEQAFEFAKKIDVEGPKT